MLRRTLSVALLCLVVAGSSLAQNPTKTYLILANGQGAGSTSFASALGSSVIAQYDEIGIVVAQSSDPNFAAQAGALSGVQSVTEDPDRAWISPNEMVVAADNAVDDSAVPPPDAVPMDRISLVFFQNPNPDTVIRCFESCVGPDATEKYPPITVAEHYLGKLMKASHSRLDAKAADAMTDAR